MLKKQAIDIHSISAAKDDEGYRLRINVFNAGSRTLYVYASPRRIQFDAVTKTIIIFFHDQHIDENSIIGRHLKEPKILPIEGNSTGEIRIKFPEVLKRIKSAHETGGDYEVEEIRAEEANTVKVEIAHQDTPFYFNPKSNNAKQLKDWGKIIAVKEFKIDDEKNDREDKAELQY